MIQIRKATTKDREAVWGIIRQVISSGDTYMFFPDSPKDKMLAYWYGQDKHTYVALSDDEIAGTFILKDNQPDLGSHVANGAYMTSPKATGKGIGRAMGEFSIGEAKRLGYSAMQFNAVVSSNERAVILWKKLGFRVMGSIPRAFDHKTRGLTDILIMYREL